MRDLIKVEIPLKTCMPILIITGDMHADSLISADSPNHGRYRSNPFPLYAHSSTGSRWHVHVSNGRAIKYISTYN